MAIKGEPGWFVSSFRLRPSAIRETSMSTPSSPTRSKHWMPAFDVLLDTVRGCGPHGQMVDVRESLRPVLGPTRPLVILCPHADDGAITAACLLHEYAVRRGMPVIEVLVFAGERNVAAPWLDTQKRVTVREAEFHLESNVLGAEGICWNLDAYRISGYEPTGSDIEKVVDWFVTRRPGAVIVPPCNDAHVAHRVTRALAAIGLVGAKLSDCLVLTGWTPWGPAGTAECLFSVRRRGRANQGVGDSLPRLAGPLDRLHPVLLASRPSLRRRSSASGPRGTACRAAPIEPTIDLSASSFSRSRATTHGRPRGFLPTRSRSPWES